MEGAIQVARGTEEVSIPAVGHERGGALTGDLSLTGEDTGLVVFAHGSGSSRRSPRNRWVADRLRQAGFGTLLMDLLTVEEDRLDSRTAELRFDIPLLTRRVLGVLDWLAEQPPTRSVEVGLFGASTGAAAALGAAARRPERTRAVVSRGGRPDLASEPLEEVRAPTLLIVGGRDEEVLALNRQAAQRLSARHHLHVVPGANHLFEEAGALEQVARAAAEWFAGAFAGRV